MSDQEIIKQKAKNRELDIQIHYDIVINEKQNILNKMKNLEKQLELENENLQKTIDFIKKIKKRATELNISDLL